MKILSTRLFRMVGVTTVAYGTVQAIRLVSNVVLARLLSPELFGIMLIINTLRTGIDLLSDIGFSQNMISNRNAEDPKFYNTVWTLQVGRGVILFIACLAVAYPLSRFYETPILATALPVAALYFLFAGFQSASMFLLQKRLRVATTSLMEIAMTSVSSAATVALAFVWPTIWALIYGNVFAIAVQTIVSHFIIRDVRHRFFISKEYLRQIVSFGKWVFVSSIVYFLAMNFDRLYLGKHVALAVLGVYGVARSFSDIISMLVVRFGNLIIFPIVASSSHSRPELKRKLAGKRAKSLLAGALCTSLFAVACPFVIELLYDQRYHAAAQMIPLLSVVVWFAIISTLGESVLLGIGRPVYQALASGAKLAAMLVALPLALGRYGMTGALVAMVAAEIVRYGTVLIGQRREHLSFVRQDVAITLLMFAMLAVWSEALWLLGVGDVSAAWFGRIVEF